MRIWIFLALCLTSVSTAWAYIPPSEFIVKNIAAKRAGTKTVKLLNKISLLESSGQLGIQLSESLKIDFKKELAQSVIMDMQGQVIHVRDGVPIPNLWKLLFVSDAEGLIKLFKDSGVPIQTQVELLKLESEDLRRAAEVMSLSRLKNRITWLLGSDKTNGRLWVEKDVFLPIQWGHTGEDGWNEMQFDLFAFQKGIPYPKQIELNHQVRIEVQEIGVNVDSKDSAVVNKPAAEPTGAVQSLLENYYRLSQ